MSVVNVKRWQWVLIGLALGLLVGYVQQQPAADWRKAFGDTLTRAEFEEGLVRQQSGLAWFHNIVVYPDRVDVPAGKALPVLIVSGDYFNGRLETQGGQRVALWRPRCLVVDGPYEPHSPGSASKAPASVLEYLKGVPGVRFTYAWWRDPRWALTFWAVGGLAVIGGVWPTTINLIAFGRFTRPIEPRGTDLSSVTARTAPAKSALPRADLDAVAKMADALELKLAAEAAAGGPEGPGPQPTVKPVQALAAAADIDGAFVAAGPGTEFGAEPDDYYPTERHRPHEAGRDPAHAERAPDAGRE